MNGLQTQFNHHPEWRFNKIRVSKRNLQNHILLVADKDMRRALCRTTHGDERKSATEQGMGRVCDFDFSGIVVTVTQFFGNVRRFFLKWVLEGGSLLVDRLIISIIM